MQTFQGRVAVVTGGASGIGRAMAERFAREGMKIVLADVEAGALAETATALRASGATVEAVVTDVAQADSMDALGRRTMEVFGGVHVVCNNAGVALSGPIWAHTTKDWEWLLGVNLWGVIHGVRVFVPLMLERGEEGHIVNTASIAGLTSNPFMGPYNVSKHGVVTLSETLQRDLGLTGSKLKVSVLCPGFVNTRIADADRNRPATLREGAAQRRSDQMEQLVRTALAAGKAPADVAQKVFEAVRDETFYILTHPEFRGRVRERMDDILEGRAPKAEMTLG